MKGTVLLVAPLLVAACSSATQRPATAAADAQLSSAAVPAAPAVDTSTTSAKRDPSASPATVNQEQSKSPTPPEGANVGPADVFPDRRSVEAMDRLAVSIPVRHTSGGDLVTLASDDTFDPGSASPTLSARWRLEDIAVALAAQANRKIRVRVYADDLGDRDEAARLSLLRAEALRDYFISRGARSEAIEAIGVGSAHPVASNATADGRRANRRIEIVVEPAR